MGNSLGTRFESAFGLKFIQGWVVLGAVITRSATVRKMPRLRCAALGMTGWGTRFESAFGLEFIQALVLLGAEIMLVLYDAAVPLGKILRLHFRSLALAFISFRMTGWGRVLRARLG